MTKLDAAAATMRANLEASSGKSLEQWVAIAKRSGKRRLGEIVAHLKDEGLTYGYASLVAHSFLKTDAKSRSETTDLVAEQYSGERASLKPIYDAIVKAAEKRGDVEIAPKKTYVSLRRSKQFAIIQPSTKTRVDLGLNIKGIAPAGRLEASGNFNAMVTHRVRLGGPADVDKDVKRWLKAAFDQA
jgi:hypothetical protein